MFWVFVRNMYADSFFNGTLVLSPHKASKKSMQFKCYAHPHNEIADAADFVVFKADSKFVTGILPSGHERLLLSIVKDRTDGDAPKRAPVLSLKTIEQTLPGILRASREVLVLATAAIEVEGESTQRQVRTVAGSFPLSRRTDVRAFELACAENAQRCATEQLAHRSPRARAYGFPCHYAR